MPPPLAPWLRGPDPNALYNGVQAGLALRAAIERKKMFEYEQRKQEAANTLAQQQLNRPKFMITPQGLAKIMPDGEVSIVPETGAGDSYKLYGGYTFRFPKGGGLPERVGDKIPGYLTEGDKKEYDRHLSDYEMAMKQYYSIDPKADPDNNRAKWLSKANLAKERMSALLGKGQEPNATGFGGSITAPPVQLPMLPEGDTGGTEPPPPMPQPGFLDKILKLPVIRGVDNWFNTPTPTEPPPGAPPAPAMSQPSDIIVNPGGTFQGSGRTNALSSSPLLRQGFNATNAAPVMSMPKPTRIKRKSDGAEFIYRGKRSDIPTDEYDILD